jgi:hypothetical protein
MTLVKKKKSQMPLNLISDAHELINEIPTVPISYLAKPQLGIRALTQVPEKAYPAIRTPLDCISNPLRPALSI